MPADIDQRKDQVAEFVLDLVRLVFRQRLAQFADLLLDLVEDGGSLRPVEADPGRTLLQLQRFSECRE